MISLNLARQLEDAGVRWIPRDGDRFMVPERDLDDDIFVVSHMVVEADDSPTGRILKFNGTTEWALDSVDQDDAVWLPREHQLRDLLGNTFRALNRPPGGWQVDIEIDGVPRSFAASTAEAAYARALLYLVTGE